MAVSSVNDNNQMITDILSATAKDKINQKSAASPDLDKDAFLQLLVTQMRYQDPLEPMDNSEYLAQLAQFSALEQMTNVSEGLSKVMTLVDNIDTSVLVGQLTSMIGQDVQWMGDDFLPHEGKIQAVSITDGAPSVVVVDASNQTQRVEIGELTRIGSLV